MDTHREIRVVRRYCCETGCRQQPVYNYPGKVRPRFCAQHSKEGMIKIWNDKKRCEHPGCWVLPSFNHVGETDVRYCSQHRLYGMVNVFNRLTDLEICEAV